MEAYDYFSSWNILNRISNGAVIKVTGFEMGYRDLSPCKNRCFLFAIRKQKKERKIMLERGEKKQRI
jgi:hypothetical protein